MKDLIQRIKTSLRDREYAEGYAESFQDTYLATQIKVVREQRNLSQADLGKLIGTTQGGVSRIEDASYSGWSVKTLKKIARALHLRLRISLEEYGTLPHQVAGMTKQSLMRAAHEDDAQLFPEKIALKSNVVSFNDAMTAYKPAANVMDGRGGIDSKGIAGADRFPPTLEINAMSLATLSGGASEGARA